MTYFGILALFLLPPLFLLLILVPRQVWRWLARREQTVHWEPYLLVLIHIAVALIYTTPWDNYLVATGVWWYHPALVTGITLGWVPIEEYTFFVLQTAITGLWTLAVLRWLAPETLKVRSSRPLRVAISAFLFLLWLISCLLFFSIRPEFNYLTLILCWGLIPVLIQTSFGADILLANWRSLALSALAPTIYLWLLDAAALSWGTWTINPAQTTGVKLGIIPLEEMLFFFLTNLIIGSGMILTTSESSKERARAWIEALRSRRTGTTQSIN